MIDSTNLIASFAASWFIFTVPILGLKLAKLGEITPKVVMVWLACVAVGTVGFYFAS